MRRDTLPRFCPLAAEVDCSRLGLSGSGSWMDGFVFSVVGSPENHNRSSRHHRGNEENSLAWQMEKDEGLDCLYRSPFVNNTVYHFIVRPKYYMLDKIVEI